MDDSRQNIIKEIVQELDFGFDCYYNSKTNEIVTIPNFSHIADEDDFKEAFRADLEKIKEASSGFYEN